MVIFGSVDPLNIGDMSTFWENVSCVANRLKDNKQVPWIAAELQINGSERRDCNNNPEVIDFVIWGGARSLVFVMPLVRW